MLDTRLTELLGCRYPIVQTAMGWVADPRLVAGSCNAGGFGFLAGATIPADEIECDILRVKELTDKPFGVNFHMYQPNASDIVELVIKHGVRAVSYSRSPGADMIRRLKDAGVICMPTVGLPKHALKAVELGADVVTVQGGEGGGHTGVVPTSLLVSACADAVDVPIVAAGGFRDGRGLVAALALGAQGIAMGTRFLLTKESPVPSATTDRYLAAGVEQVRVTDRIDGLPQRVVSNELVERLEEASALERLVRAFASALALREETGASFAELLRAALAMRRHERLTRSQMLMAANAPMLAKKAMTDGDPVHGYLPSGTVAGVIDDRPTCAELVGRIVEEAERTLAALAGKETA